ncbi:MAG: ABC transporter substrate-binding protein [Lacisediminihabitans sp.]
MNRFRPGVVAVASAAIAVLALSGCSSSPTSTPSDTTSAPKTMTTVNFLTDFVANGVQSPLYDGIEQGYYKAEGIDLKITAGTGSINTITAVAAGQVDIGDALSANLAQAVDKGTLLTSVGWFRANSAFAFFCDKKLNITSVAQMKGHSILIPPGTAQASMLPGVLAAAGLTRSDLTVDAVASKTVGATYAGGQDDCITQTLGDAPTFQSMRPSTVISWSGAGFAVPGFAFFVTPSYLSAHQDVVAAFLRATYKSIAASLKNPADAVAAFEKNNPTVDPSLAKAQFKASQVVYCTTAAAKAKSDIGAMTANEWSSLVSVLQKYAGLSSSVTPDKLYTDQFFKGSDSVSSTACEPQFAS